MTSRWIIPHLFETKKQTFVLYKKISVFLSIKTGVMELENFLSFYQSEFLFFVFVFMLLFFFFKYQLEFIKR